MVPPFQSRRRSASGTSSDGVLRAIPSLLRVCVVAMLGRQVTPYGMDCSFPIVNRTLHGCDSGLVEQHRQAMYREYMEGCYAYHGAGWCDAEEDERMDMNWRQPQSMINLTSTGYQKVRAPDSLMNLLTDFWEANKDSMEEEDWPNTLSNYWTIPSYMVDVDDPELVGGGETLKAKIWEAAKAGVKEWTGGAKLRPSSLYGIRVYKEGAILNSHVDRLPLISSAIVNVAQDVDEDWPLEVYDRSGTAVNISMKPGDMIFYESHSLIHGRPFPLKGRFVANIFIHFEPFEVYSAEQQIPSNGDLPPYILPGSPWAQNWTKENPEGWLSSISSTCHEYAATGSLSQLKEVKEWDARLIHVEDAFGWQPIHEAVRGGHVEIVQYLIDHGADVNARTGDDDGPTPLNMAKTIHGLDHPITALLTSLNCVDIMGIYDDDEDEDEGYDSHDRHETADDHDDEDDGDDDDDHDDGDEEEEEDL